MSIRSTCPVCGAWKVLNTKGKFVHAHTSRAECRKKDLAAHPRDLMADLKKSLGGDGNGENNDGD